MVEINIANSSRIVKIYILGSKTTNMLCKLLHVSQDVRALPFV